MSLNITNDYCLAFLSSYLQNDLIYFMEDFSISHVSDMINIIVFSSGIVV